MGNTGFCGSTVTIISSGEDENTKLRIRERRNSKMIKGGQAFSRRKSSFVPPEENDGIKTGNKSETNGCQQKRQTLDILEEEMSQWQSVNIEKISVTSVSPME